MVCNDHINCTPVLRMYVNRERDWSTSKRELYFPSPISPKHADQGTTPKPPPSSPPAPTWPSTTSSAAGSLADLPSTLFAASSSYRRYRQLSPLPVNHTYTSIPDSRPPLLWPPLEGARAASGELGCGWRCDG
jgi:hypothetical protein